MEYVTYGPHALLIHFARAPGEAAYERCASIMAELERNPLPGLVHFVPGFTTLLLEFDPQLVPNVKLIAAQTASKLSKIRKAKPAKETLKEFSIVYDGPDLARVAEHNRLSLEEVVQLHSNRTYRVYMLGFSPGFPYLGELDRKLHTPRLPTPRPVVKAGSVGIGGQHTGIYSLATPGGWNIIGHVSETIFDPSRQQTGPESMFLLHPGDQVRFVRRN